MRYSQRLQIFLLEYDTTDSRAGQLSSRRRCAKSFARDARNLIEWDFGDGVRSSVAHRPLRLGSGRFASAFQSKWYFGVAARIGSRWPQ